MRCPHCGARNKDGAEWCVQCYRVLVEPTGPREPVETPPTDPVQPAPVPTSSSADWRCPVCGEGNPIASDRCGTCGTLMVVAFTPARSEHDEETIRRWSALPGGGHMKAGAGPVGGGILLVVLMALGFGSALVSAPVTRVVGVLILVLGTGTWVLGAHDVQRHLATGSPWIFQPRVISGLAGGVVTLLFVAVLLAI